MTLQPPTAEVCFVAVHTGPADHFVTFAEGLTAKGHKVSIYASGPALKKVQDRLPKSSEIEVIPFSLESEQDAALKIAEKCEQIGARVIGDVGHAFSVTLQDTFAKKVPEVSFSVYYDNPERVVPGEYSVFAEKVLSVANRVLFANANLASHREKEIGIGYYPIAHAEKLRQQRETKKCELREKFFSSCALEDQGQQVLVYAGGNNEVYFSEAFPAFLEFLQTAGQDRNFVILLQQHPGAKEKNIDGKLLQEWLKNYDVKVFVSNMNSDDAQVIADAMLYYQTSMGPQFVLAGIPTIQVGRRKNEDILTKNGLCFVANSAESLSHAFQGFQQMRESNDDLVKTSLGIHADWLERLEKAIF